VWDSNEGYRRLVESSPDGIVVSQNARLVFVNRAALRLFAAAAPDQLLGRSLVDLVHPRSYPLIERGLERGVAPGIAAQVIRLDGSIAAVEVTIAAFDGEDRVRQLVVRDLGERARAEATLRESEERLRLAFEGAQEGLWDWNLETGAVFYSPRWKQMLGYEGEEIEPHVSAWERLLHPDDRARAAELNESVIRGERMYEGEFRLRHKDGHYVEVLTRGFAVRREPGGLVVRIVGTHFDLTERKRAEAALRESEERLRLAFAGAQEGVWDWNLETNAVVYSARWKQMLGYEEDEIEPHVSAWERLVHPDDRRVADEANDSVASGEATYEAEFRLRHKDGHYVHVLSRGFPVRREPGGPVIRIVGTHFDLTERKQAEEIERQADEERARRELLTRLVFAQEDERRRIAREMHDQFGEQLTTLGLRIAALKAALAGRSELNEHVDALEAVSERLDRDVEQLVWQLRPTALDDLGLRAALANYVQNWSARAGIAAALHTSGLLDERLASETETTLYRIAQEALTNVAKHSRAGNVEVILERRNDSVLLVIEDDGVGFNADETGESRGFGLLGMRERAAVVGATLEIESTPGTGTTILVRMPVPAANGTAARHA
jgi:PAS domain S-box-containing protein